MSPPLFRLSFSGRGADQQLFFGDDLRIHLRMIRCDFFLDSILHQRIVETASRNRFRHKGLRAGPAFLFKSLWQPTARRNREFQKKLRAGNLPTANQLLAQFAASVPEPTSTLLLAVGLMMGVTSFRHRRA